MNDKIYKTQLFRFCLTGVTAVLIDLIVYLLMSSVYNETISKMVSFLSGSFFSFLLNKLWTFEKKSKTSVTEVSKFTILYTSTLILNTLTNFVTLNYVIPNKLLGFIIATAVSTILNFCGQKWWVFKK